MSEPLKGKELLGGNVVNDEELPYFDKSEVKSALEWMIEQHEEKIEELKKRIKEKDGISGYKYTYYPEFGWIDIHKEAIMILQEGLSDVV